LVSNPDAAHFSAAGATRREVNGISLAGNEARYKAPKQG